jgi:hypothetical protein
MLPGLAQWRRTGVDRNLEQARQRHDLQIAARWILRVAPAQHRNGIENALGIPVDVSESGGARWPPPLAARCQGSRKNAERHRSSSCGQEVDLDRPVALISAVKPARVRHRVSLSLSAPFDKFGSIRGVSVWSRNRSSLHKALYDEPTER